MDDNEVTRAKAPQSGFVSLTTVQCGSVRLTCRDVPSMARPRAVRRRRGEFRDASIVQLFSLPARLTSHPGHFSRREPPSQIAPNTPELKLAWIPLVGRCCRRLRTGSPCDHVGSSLAHGQKVASCPLARGSGALRARHWAEQAIGEMQLEGCAAHTELSQVAVPPSDRRFEVPHRQVEALRDGLGGEITQVRRKMAEAPSTGRGVSDRVVARRASRGDRSRWSAMAARAKCCVRSAGSSWDAFRGESGGLRDGEELSSHRMCR